MTLASHVRGTVGAGLCVVASPVVGDELGREVTAAARRRVEAAAGTSGTGGVAVRRGSRMGAIVTEAGTGHPPLTFFAGGRMDSLNDMLNRILTVNDRLADEPVEEDDDDLD